MSLIDQSCESLNAYRAAGGLRGLEAALSASPDDVIATVLEGGLRGRGGGGFPTGEKWDAIRNVGNGDRYVVCNAAEGEPATFKDRYLLRTNPYQVLEGILIAAYAVGAAGAYIGLKEAFTGESDALVRAAQEMHDAGVADPVPIEIVSGPDLYLVGEETGLLEVVEGRPPLPRSHRPYMEGLFAAPPKENPTLVNNAETLANVPHILHQGPDWLRASGTEQSPGTMLFTLTGDVEREGVFELTLGTPLRALVEDAGGGVRGGGAMKVIVPGSSTTVLVASQLDVGLDFEDMAATGSGLGSGEITAHLERIERGEGDEGDVGLMLARAKTVTDGQKCALPTGESLLIQSVIQTFTEEFQAHERRRCDRYRDELVLPKILDYDEDAGRFRYDETYRRKQPDWTFALPAD